ncbi:MFS transporter [Bacillus sp. SL00103]
MTYRLFLIWHCRWLFRDTRWSHSLFACWYDQFHEAFIPTALLFFLSFSCHFSFCKRPHQPLPFIEQKRRHFSAGIKKLFARLKDEALQAGFYFYDCFFMNDALQTAIAMMAVYAKIIIGFTAGQFILLYLVSTISSIIGSFLFGYITKSDWGKALDYSRVCDFDRCL